MGKKSLFTPTTDPEAKEGAAAAPKKKRAAKKQPAKKQPAKKASTKKQKAPVSQAAGVLPENDVVETTTSEAVAPPPPAGDGRPQPAAVFEKTAGCSAPVQPPAMENGDDAMTRLLWGASAFLVLAVLILLVASSMNAGRYYVTESRGAVEIWKGDFTPGGKERIMVLHDAAWDVKKKRTYSKADVFAFASRFYTAKAGDLLEAEGMRDYSRILSYVDRAIELNADMGRKDQVEVLEIVKKYVQEAAILDSGEPATRSVVTKRLNDASHALAGLLFEEYQQ
ncbi:hypothetical protein [Desulfosudis oleivorans]|uniref:Uncharacterized protein n=1 Tax=Desulfosudis oleivorans (strain DSM 6200 / JCM 39069 / Hxd3) TaxID=96561 RepID=A9A001_DESOH|nr:hypothetical protein [Desulfosudis oleivorans]ABW67401.1 hypothetical protein Dole_1597 [Desulfosudis oleivorans Hxd3]